ncbi:MAG: redox-regulated ATPase YchF, partial [SAR202 cluster bacterium]|nr:redox-regulated ATPase YchF [SAR202 cluster bacterium]
MGFKCGIVGLPNVGKSTLFNALTKTAMAQAENYPFCTIEPNVGEVAIPDPRLYELADIAKSENIVPTRMTFVDIAGLVKGASKGEGLGNQFLANIREMDAIAYVLRCFDDENIVHVEGKIDPISDLETVETELMLADLETLEKREYSLEKKAKSGDKEAQDILGLVERALVLLREGRPVRTMDIKPVDEALFKSLQLLTAKPVLYVCNVDESDASQGNQYSQLVFDTAKKEGAGAVLISAKIESELSQLESNDQQEFLQELGLEEPGLVRMIYEGYDLLDLMTYFTAGP